MTRLTMGANIPLAAPAVRASLRWSGGPGVPDVDASALLLDASGNVARDDDFVFYNQPRHPSGAVTMAGKTSGPRASDQIDVDLRRVPAATTRIVLAASADGGTFGQVPGLELVLLDLATSEVLADFPMQASTETAFLSAEIYRRNDEWKFRAVGQGYASGLAGLAADFGIDATGADAAPPVPAAAPPYSAPAPPAPAPPPPAPAAPSAPPAPEAARPASAPQPAERDPGYDPLLDLG